MYLIAKGRKDQNQAAIVTAMRQMGALVYPLDRPVDLLCGFRHRIFLVEIKDGTLPPSKRRLTDDEAKFCQQWRGYPVYVIESVDEAVELLTILT